MTKSSNYSTHKITSPDLPPLDSESIHLWWIQSGMSSSVHHFLHAKLSADEQARAQRYRFEKDQHRFIMVRAMLRLLLSHYAGLPVSSITFGRGKHGKPYLSYGDTSQAPQFNVSHSKGWVVLAFSRHARLGVDIEYIDPDVNMHQIIEMTLSDTEKTALFALPEHQQRTAFFHMWSRKEALTKAIGIGMHTSFPAIGLTPWPETPIHIRELSPTLSSGATWRLEDISPNSDYVAALAYDVQPASLNHFTINPTGLEVVFGKK